VTGSGVTGVQDHRLVVIRWSDRLQGRDVFLVCGIAWTTTMTIVVVVAVMKNG
jgi:hypothetical protein